MQLRETITQARMSKRGSLDELSGKRLLAQFGVAVPASIMVRANESLGAQLGGLKPPFVVKVMSPEILHKSDVGGVRVGLGNVAEVEAAIRSMLEKPAISRLSR